MAAFSQYLQKKILDHLLKTAVYTPETNLYIGLCSTSPTDTTMGTEVTGTNYSRVNFNTWNVATSASPSIATNNGIISFATPGAGGWGTATHFIITNSLSGTADINLLAWGVLSVPKTINQNDTVSFASGQLSISLD